MSSSRPVADDPFFGVVRRRHPDVDIVLLPPEDPEDPERPDHDGHAEKAAPPLLQEDAESAVESLEGLAQSLWRDALGAPPPDTSRRWTPPAARPQLVVTCASPDLGAVEAEQGLARLQRRLAEEGWHVLAPETGMPRVLASRASDAPVGSPADELVAVHVPSSGRFALEWRRGPWLAGAAGEAGEDRDD